MLADQNGATPHQHSPAQPSHSTRRQRDAADAHHDDDHASIDAALDSAYSVKGQCGRDDRVSTPDLSPRAGTEAEDPPTPRMYKAIIPTAGPGQMQNHVSAPRSPQMGPEATQVVLHQGHFDHGRQHASLQRHAQHTGQEQAMEDLRHTVRHALTGSISCGSSQQQQQALSCLLGLVNRALSFQPQMDLLLVLDCHLSGYCLASWPMVKVDVSCIASTCVHVCINSAVL